MAKITFEQFIDDLYIEVDNKNTRVLPFLRSATVRQLRELSSTRVRFMEAYKMFNLIPGQREYSLAYPDSLPDGFPRDLQEIDVVTVMWGSDAVGGSPEDPDPNLPPSWDPGNPPVTAEGSGYGYVIEQISLKLIQYTYHWDTVDMWPQSFAWHHDSFILDRIPSAATLIRMDYLRDGTKDDNSGAEITPAASVETNGWFDQGLNCLRCAVLGEYHTSISKDPQSAQMYYSQKAELLRGLRTDWIQQNWTNTQSQFYL